MSTRSLTIMLIATNLAMTPAVLAQSPGADTIVSRVANGVSDPAGAVVIRARSAGVTGLTSVSHPERRVGRPLLERTSREPTRADALCIARGLPDA